MISLKTDQERLKEKLKEIGVEDVGESRILGEVYIMLSLACNLRCKFCSWWGIKGPCSNKSFMKKYSSTLTSKELKRFADDITSLRPRTVTFSGGEPLLYDKWYLLAKYIKDKGTKVSLTTNGVLLQKKFKKIIDVVDELNISLEGYPFFLSFAGKSASAHIEDITQGLKMLTVIKGHNSNRPIIKILYTISDLSYSQMSGFIKFMGNEGIKIDRYLFQHLMFINQDNFEFQKKIFLKEFNIRDCNIWKGFTYSSSKFNFPKLSAEIKKIKRFKNVSFSPDLHTDELPDYYKYNRWVSRYSKYCTAPWHQLNVMPNGDVYICPDYFIGNIKNRMFEDIWNGQEARRLRNYIAQKLFPGCRGCFYYYTEKMA